MGRSWECSSEQLGVFQGLRRWKPSKITTELEKEEIHVLDRRQGVITGKKEEIYDSFKFGCQGEEQKPGGQEMLLGERRVLMRR